MESAGEVGLAFWLVVDGQLGGSDLGKDWKKCCTLMMVHRWP